MRIKPKVYFESFWPGFDCRSDPIFGGVLAKRFDVLYCEELKEADVVFCSWYSSDSHNSLRYHKEELSKLGKKLIYYTAEHDGAGLPGIGQLNFEVYDRIFSHYNCKDARHVWMPNYVRRFGINIFSEVNNSFLKNKLQQKNKDIQFCYSNSLCKERNEAYAYLNRLVNVDCGGKLFNTTGKYLPRNLNDYIAALAEYKFIFAYENASYPGYNTEKIVNALMAGGVPIYWGDVHINSIWNQECFIDMNHREKDVYFDYLAANLTSIFEEYNSKDALPCPNAGLLEQKLESIYLGAFSDILGVPPLPPSNT